MSKSSFEDNFDANEPLDEKNITQDGPYVTISRQYGCQGFALGMLLLDILNEQSPTTPWQIFQRDILERLARETGADVSTLERQRHAKPHLVGDFLRSFGKHKIPTGQDVRNRIANIIHELAVNGHAIIVGQGSAGITAHIPNGLSIRLEAPEDWRIKQIVFRKEITEAQARSEILETEKQRQYTRQIYRTRYRHSPAFNITFDCSVFSLAQIAQQIVYMMKLKKLVT